VWSRTQQIICLCHSIYVLRVRAVGKDDRPGRFLLTVVFASIAPPPRFAIPPESRCLPTYAGEMHGSTEGQRDCVLLGEMRRLVGFLSRKFARISL
jgi:hypothetical protein